MSWREMFTNLIQRIDALEGGSDLRYYKCQWEKKLDYVSSIYLVYRWIHVLIIAAILCTSMIKEMEGSTNKWFIFFTNWIMILHFLQATFGVFIVTEYCIRGGKAVSTLKRHELLSLYGAFQSCAVTLVFSTTVVYWTVVYSQGWGSHTFMKKFTGMNPLLP